MEITINDIMSSAVFLMGLNILITGQVHVESGVTNGGNGTNDKFLYSTKQIIKGLRAKFIGAALCLMAVGIHYFFEPGKVLLSF